MSIAKSGQQLRSPGQPSSADGTPPIPGFLQGQQLASPDSGHGHPGSVLQTSPDNTTRRGERRSGRGVSNGHVLGLVGGLALAAILIVVLVVVLARPGGDDGNSDQADNVKTVDATPSGAEKNAGAPSRPPRPNDDGQPPRDPPVVEEPADVAPDAISLEDLKSELELQADAALARGRAAPLIPIRESSEFLQNQESARSFTGIDDGVNQVFISWPAFGSFIVIEALASQAPQDSEDVNILELFSSDKIVDSAMESLQDRKAEDYYGRAAFQYAFWKVASQTSPQHDAEIAGSELEPAQKRKALMKFNLLRQQMANRFKSNYGEMMRRGAKAGLQVP